MVACNILLDARHVGPVVDTVIVSAWRYSMILHLTTHDVTTSRCRTMIHRASVVRTVMLHDYTLAYVESGACDLATHTAIPAHHQLHAIGVTIPGEGLARCYVEAWTVPVSLARWKRCISAILAQAILCALGLHMHSEHQ